MPGTVLIIDDDQDTCVLLKTCLTSAGYDVETRFDGSSALDSFRESPFDVVVTDVRMPRMDGLEVLRSLKSMDPDVGVIICSAAVEDRTRVTIDALRGGAADYFIKPLDDLSELEQAVARAVAHRAAGREHAKRLRELEMRARTDPLTGLANRLELEQRLREEFSRLGRGVEEFALAMFDIDSFKKINDTHGHLVGDYVLTAVAHALRDSCRAYDVKARYGGDEFVVVMPYTRLDHGIAVAEKIRRAVGALSLKAGEEPLHVTLSAGVTSVSPREGITPEELIGRADSALMKAKKADRDQMVTWERIEPAADVLIVDGSESEARSLIGLCESLGCRAEWAATGAEAVERVRRARHPLALVGISLPDIDGAEAIGRIREVSPATTAALVTDSDPASARVLDLLSRAPLILARKPLSAEHLKTLLLDARRRG